MTHIPGISHMRAVRALEKAGFRIVREGKHIVMSDGNRFLTIPRANPINAHTMAGIVKDAGLTVEAFRELLQTADGRGLFPRESAFSASFRVTVLRKCPGMIILYK
jgi:predicted RNA binding protein YcfA (HicA-like mRNA interferase family)